MTDRRYGSYLVQTSREQKVLFPEDGVTKGDLIYYYEEVAGAILPHLRDRPIVMQRFPDGIGEQGFYHKQVPDHFPDWIQRVRVEKSAGAQELVLCDKTATLVYLANQAAITLHPWLSRRDELNVPDQMIFDLDPPQGGGFQAVRRASSALRDLLEEVDLPAYVKLTGSKGVHVVVPIIREDGFDEVRSFARDLCEVLARRRPDDLTTSQRKDRRRGRLYLDSGRNAYGQTAVAPYSVRPLPGAPVAAPVEWDEIQDGLGPRDISTRDALTRVRKGPDPWKGMRRRARGLRSRRESLDRLLGQENRGSRKS